MQGKLQLGGTLAMFRTWMRQVALGVALKKPLTPREDGALEGKKRRNDQHGHFLQMWTGRREILSLFARLSVGDALRTYSRQAGHTTAPISPIVKLG